MARRTVVVAIALSLAVHAVIALIAALMTLRSGDGSSDGPAAATVEFAVMEDEAAAVRAGGARASAPAAPTLTLDTMALEAPRIDTDVELRVEINDIEIDAGAGDAASVDEGLSGASGNGGASFFGLEASGRRFLYIVDYSGSMVPEDRIERLRGELKRSLDALRPSAEFLVIPYNDGAAPLRRPPRWIDATERAIEGTYRKLRDLTPAGGTRPIEAFSLAFRQRPLPDAIYFMTDGDFQDEDVPGVVRAMNIEHAIPVHCVLFGKQASANASRSVARDMRRIADDSGGEFTRVGGR